MGRKRPDMPGYNVYQARLYTIENQLAYKRTYVDAREAEDALLRYMEDQQKGHAYSRGVIRCLDPGTCGWIIYRSIPNPNAGFFDPSETPAEEWELSFYGMEDQCIQVARFHREPNETHLKVCMITFGAVYAVLAAHGLGATGKQFLVVKIFHNRYFNLHLFKTAEAQCPVHSAEELMERYHRALEQDQEETERILESRRWEEMRGGYGGCG